MVRRGFRHKDEFSYFRDHEYPYLRPADASPDDRAAEVQLEDEDPAEADSEVDALEGDERRALLEGEPFFEDEIRSRESTDGAKAAGAVESTPGAGSRTERIRRRVIAAVVVSAVVLAVLWTARLVQPDAPGRPHTSAAVRAAAQLDEAEVAAIFADVVALRDEAFARRDLGRLAEVYTGDSPVRDVAAREIRALRAEDALDKSSIATLDIDVLDATGGEIQIRQTARVTPRLVADWGPILSTKPPERQVVLWTLRRDRDGRWLIYDAVLEESAPARD